MFNISKSIWYSIMTQHFCSKSHYNLIICSDFIWLVPVKMYPLRYLSFFLLALHTEEIHHIILRSYRITLYHISTCQIHLETIFIWSLFFLNRSSAVSLLLLIGILESTNSIKNTFAISSSFPEIHKFHSSFWSQISSDWSVLSTHAAALYRPAICCLTK